MGNKVKASPGPFRFPWTLQKQVGTLEVVRNMQMKSTLKNQVVATPSHDGVQQQNQHGESSHLRIRKVCTIDVFHG